MCGDFNLPHVSWPEGTPCTGASREEKTMAQDLSELMEEHFLFQQIQKSTHRRGNVLDLCFCNNPEFLHSYQCTETALSDHHIIECHSTYSKRPAQQTSDRQPHTSDGPAATFDQLNFMSEEVDWDGLDRELQDIDWESEFNALSPSQMLSKLIDTCSCISQKYVPRRKACEKKTNKIPRIRRILMRRRSKVNKQLASSPSDAKRTKLTAEAREIEKKLQESYKNQRAEMEHKAVSAIKKNSKYFFSYARKYSKVDTGIGPLIDLASSIITCPLQMANMLAEQYSSVFSTPKEELTEADDIFPECEGGDTAGRPKLADIKFSAEDIARAIGEVSSTAAAGPERYPAMLLKQCRTALSKPLYIMWRKSLDTGDIPLILKTANVVPVHKGGSRGIPKNYRPIALTSHLIKVFEKVLRNHVVAYMERHGLFNPSQHGFRLGRSCLSQLIAHYDHILELLANGVNVDVVYIDFAKAFDKVDFMVTLKKLKGLGISGKVGKWIHSFLTNRSQVVLVRNARSQPMAVKSGVPQGSVLGPLLFLVLIGDIDQGIARAFLSSFADDTRIGSQIASEGDSLALQADLNAVYSWTTENNMELNGDKFECLRYGTNQELQNSTSYKSNSGSTIQEKDYVKDLGITMSNDATFKYTSGMP